MSFIYSLLAAFIPIFFYLIFIWRIDRNEREAFKDVLKHFLWGAVGAIFLALLFSTLFDFALGVFIPNDVQISFLGAVLVAPFVEEITKGIYLVNTYRKKYFDNITDGLVYGGAIGLGFGMTENLLYFTTYDDTFEQWLSVVLTRSIFSAVMHAIATATLGAFFAKAKFTTKTSRQILPLIGFFLAMSFHAFWNFSLTFEFTFYIGILFMIFLIISFFVVFSYSLKTEQKIIVNELKEEMDIPKEHIIILGTTKKFGRKWLDKSIRKDYVRFATLLAFRKFQSKNTSGKLQEEYLADTEMYRKKVIELLNLREV